MVHKNTNIPLSVLRVLPETSGYLSVFFTRPRDFNFQAGDWIDITSGHGELSGGSTYSIASSPTEPDIRITFREGLSGLKRALAGAQPGDRFTIFQYGNDYGFHIPENSAGVLVAGGVGIAPFRSMLKEMADTGDKSRVKLLYLNKTADFLFQDELEQWSRQLPGLTVAYIITDQLKRKAREKQLLQLLTPADRAFYIAGPESMVTSTRTLLVGAGVADKAIKIDSFGGY